METTIYQPSSSSGVQRQGPGLRPGQFRRIATAGFGSAENSYPHAMGWYKDHLYVGTTRCVLALIYHRRKGMQKWALYPVRTAKTHPYKEFDIRSQVWRYSPATETWKKVLTSPMVTTKEGDQLPVFLGCRNMIQFQRPSETEAALYLLTWSPKGGPGPGLMRTDNGDQFERVTIKGFGVEQFSSFRPLVNFNGRLFTAPTGRAGTSSSAGCAVVLTTKDPMTDTWDQANQPNFGDPHNETVFEMTVFDNHLYAGTYNVDGLQLWKTRAEGEPPFHWEKVIDRGAGRGPTNQLVGSLAEFNGALYVGTAISSGGYDKERGVGPAPAEVLRVWPDDTYDLLVADGRLVGDHIRMPLSGMRAGFNKMSNSYIWRMCVHEGWLYVGTYSWAGMLPYLPRDKWPEDKRRLLDTERTRWVIDNMGGFDLWRTRDGIIWSPITRNGFANPYNYGVRTMASTPQGLFVGTANPFGPEVAVERTGGWQYEMNPRGGLEIWQGSQEIHTTPVHPADEGVHISEPEEGLLPTGAYHLDNETEVLESVLHDFFEQSGFRCFGMWNNKTRSARAACEQLLHELLSFLPDFNGHLVDLGCGAGASTRYLSENCPLATVKAVAFKEGIQPYAELYPDNIQLETRSSAKLSYPDGSIDAVINLQTLSETTHPKRWLKEAYRVLKPGGRFVGAEILSGHPQTPWVKGKGLRLKPIRTPGDFETLWTELGFEEVKVMDVTEDCWKAFRRKFELFLWEKAIDYELDEELVEKVKKHFFGQHEPLDHYIIVAANKPG